MQRQKQNPSTTQTIQKAFKKMVNNEQTTLINGLTHDNAEYEKLTDEEKIAAGLMSVPKGIVKIVSGTAMIGSGLVLAAIPKVVATINTDQTYKSKDENGPKVATITRVGLKSQQQHQLPSYYERVTERDNQQNPEMIDRSMISGSTRTIGRLMEPEGTVTNREEYQHLPTRTQTTVTGLNLATSGVGQLITGVIDPIRGLISAGYFSYQKFKASLATPEKQPLLESEHISEGKRKTYGTFS